MKFLITRLLVIRLLRDGDGLDCPTVSKLITCMRRKFSEERIQSHKYQSTSNTPRLHAHTVTHDAY